MTGNDERIWEGLGKVSASSWRMCLNRDDCEFEEIGQRGRKDGMGMKGRTNLSHRRKSTFWSLNRPLEAPKVKSLLNEVTIQLDSYENARGGDSIANRSSSSG